MARWSRSSGARWSRSSEARWSRSIAGIVVGVVDGACRLVTAGDPVVGAGVAVVGGVVDCVLDVDVGCGKIVEVAEVATGAISSSGTIDKSDQHREQHQSDHAYDVKLRNVFRPV